MTIARLCDIIIIREDNGENFEKEDTDMPRLGGGGFGGGPRGGGLGRPGGDFEGPWMGWRPRPPYGRPPFGGRPPRRPYYGGCFPWGCGCCLPIIGVVRLQSSAQSCSRFGYKKHPHIAKAMCGCFCGKSLTKREKCGTIRSTKTGGRKNEK